MLIENHTKIKTIEDKLTDAFIKIEDVTKNQQNVVYVDRNNDGGIDNNDENYNGEDNENNNNEGDNENKDNNDNTGTGNEGKTNNTGNEGLNKAEHNSNDIPNENKPKIIKTNNNNNNILDNKNIRQPDYRTEINNIKIQIKRNKEGLDQDIIMLKNSIGHEEGLPVRELIRNQAIGQKVFSERVIR